MDIIKPNTLCVHTPHIVFPSHFLCSYINTSLTSSLGKCRKAFETTLRRYFLPWWAWPLTLWPWPTLWPRYPPTWPSYQISSLYVSWFDQESETDIQTNTETHRQCQNYYTLHVTDAECHKTIYIKVWVEHAHSLLHPMSLTWWV